MLAEALVGWLWLLAAGPAELESLTVLGRLQQAAEGGLSVTSLGNEQIQDLNPTHPNELFSRVPGTWISRGSGQEHLTAIRSPVLTGAGACGAFSITEDGIPIRPAGFCNVNNLFEINLKQAAQVEVLRGPGSVVHGGNALHGVINANTRSATGSSNQLSLSVGGDDFRQLAGRWTNSDSSTVNLMLTDAGSFRDNESYFHGHFGLRLEHGENAFTTLSGFDLDQETAGFIFGQDAYRDDELRHQNINPEAYRKGAGFRLASHWRQQLSATTDLIWVPYARHSRMTFLQHFLPGQPLERNSQESVGMQLNGSRLGANGLLLFGLDLEFMQGELLEFQERELTVGSAFLQATRPQGRHYDYQADGLMLASYIQHEWWLAEGVWLRAGLRGEWTRYDYDNRMSVGNLKDDGTPCGFGGCLYTRPADRSDSFVNFAPELALGGQWGGNAWQLRLARGFRPPQTTELYRLQRGQLIADIDPETLDSIEFGVSGGEKLDWSVTAFAARKRDFIFRDAGGFNVSDGRSQHRGLEWSLSFAAAESLTLGTTGSYARHEYDFDRIAGAGEIIRNGNEVDTAPRMLSQWYADWDLTEKQLLRAELDWQDDYFLNAANTARYSGHRLVQLHYKHRLNSSWWLQLQIRNLLDKRYAERADFAFGNYRYFPGNGRQLLLELSWRGE